MMVSESQEMYSGCQWIMETIRKNENILNLKQNANYNFKEIDYFKYIYLKYLLLSSFDESQNRPMQS